MSYTNGLDKPSDYFNTVLYTGDGTASQPQTGVGFQPDWVWIKIRSTTGGHGLYDVIRGATERLRSDSTNAESTATDGLTSFDSDGFTVGNNSSTGTSSATYAAWNWLAGGTASSNTDGSITSQVSANTTSGFSIVQWTGTQANGTIGHGLGVAPSMIIVKADAVKDWMVGHDGIGWTKYINLNTTSAASTASTVWQDTAPTSSVFSVGSSSDVNTSSTSMIAYCFAEKKGFSKFGSYVGTGSGTGGVFNYLGFKPAMVIIKASSTTGEWLMYDNKRSPFNETRLTLSADNSDAEEEVGTRKINMFSNGFEIGSNSAYTNSSGQTYIYMAFAEHPFVSSTGTPVTAR